MVEPFPSLNQRRLLHFVAAGDLEQGRAALAEEVQGGVRVQQLDGVLPQMVGTSKNIQKNVVLMCLKPS